MLADHRECALFAISSQNGDVADIPRLGRAGAICALSAVPTDNCLGRDCHVMRIAIWSKPGAEALNQVVVINHHHSFADLVVKITGFCGITSRRGLHFR